MFLRLHPCRSMYIRRGAPARHLRLLFPRAKMHIEEHNLDPALSKIVTAVWERSDLFRNVIDPSAITVKSDRVELDGALYMSVGVSPAGIHLTLRDPSISMPLYRSLIHVPHRGECRRMHEILERYLSALRSNVLELLHLVLGACSSGDDVKVFLEAATSDVFSRLGQLLGPSMERSLVRDFSRRRIEVVSVAGRLFGRSRTDIEEAVSVTHSVLDILDDLLHGDFLAAVFLLDDYYREAVVYMRLIHARHCAPVIDVVAADAYRISMRIAVPKPSSRGDRTQLQVRKDRYRMTITWNIDREALSSMPLEERLNVLQVVNNMITNLSSLVRVNVLGE